MTPLEITTSAQPSATGSVSAKPLRNSTCRRPSAAAVWHDLASISAVMSMPITWPPGPTWPAAMKESNPAPEPTSTTLSPGASRRSENGSPTPAKDSMAASGSAPTAPTS
jgi:hypothetical protein